MSKKKIKKKPNPQRDTWVGFRPSVVRDRKKDKKRARQEGKAACKDVAIFCNGYVKLKAGPQLNQLFTIFPIDFFAPIWYYIIVPREGTRK